jgi:putative SOS response-associated peptidase YedK
MCNRARGLGEPETLIERFGSSWFTPRPMDNRFNPAELTPRSRAWVLRYPMNNVRNLKLPQWQRLAAKPENRCLIPLVEFCEWTPEPMDLGDGKKPIKGEMWFRVTDQPIFAVAGFWQQVGPDRCFAMVTCDPNELVAPIHPKAMITVLAEADWERWLRGSFDDVVALQRPYPANLMRVRGPEFPTRTGASILT